MPWDEQGNLISYDEWRRRMVEKGKLKPLSPAPSVPSTPARPKPQSTVFREAIKAGVPKTPFQQIQGLQTGQVFLNVPPRPSQVTMPTLPKEVPQEGLLERLRNWFAKLGVRYAAEPPGMAGLAWKREGAKPFAVSHVGGEFVKALTSPFPLPSNVQIAPAKSPAEQIAGTVTGTVGTYLSPAWQFGGGLAKLAPAASGAIRLGTVAAGSELQRALGGEKVTPKEAATRIGISAAVGLAGDIVAPLARRSIANTLAKYFPEKLPKSVEKAVPYLLPAGVGASLGAARSTARIAGQWIAGEPVNLSDAVKQVGEETALSAFVFTTLAALGLAQKGKTADYYKFAKALIQAGADKPDTFAEIPGVAGIQFHYDPNTAKVQYRIAPDEAPRFIEQARALSAITPVAPKPEVPKIPPPSTAPVLPEVATPETKPVEAAKPETPPTEELPVKVGERMTAYRKRTGKEYTGIIERVYRGKQGQLLADIRLDDNTMKTIPASRKYTEWRTPKVEVPEVKAPEAPEVEAEVPTVPEVKPETPPVAEKPAAKEPWQMARDEYAALAAPHKLPPEYKALKAISDRDDGRPYNPHDITEEAVASLRTQGLISGVKKLKVKYPEGYHKLQDWLDLEKDNELVIGDALDRHYEIVRQALIEGKPVPPEVLKDYPDLASMVAPEAKAEHERELDMPKLEWGKQAPDYKSTLQSFAAWKRFLEEAKEVAYIDQPYGHKVPVYYYKGQLVRVGPSSSTSGHRYPVHIVDPNQYGEYFHWRNRQDVIEIAKKFGAEVRAKPRPVVLDIELGGSMQGTLKKPTSRVEIVQPESVTAKPEVPSVPEKPTELKPVAEAKVTPPAEVPAATAPQPKKEAPEVQKAPPGLPVSPPVSQQQEEVRTTIKGIISAFERLGAPVRVGRYAKKARGIYKVQPEIIRTKLFGDVVAIAHEVGHHLNKLWKLSSMTEHRDELVALAEAAGVEEESQSGLVKEGIAEFVRLTILDPATAQKQAPAMWNTWQALLNDHPEVANTLDEVHQRISGLMSANPEERLLATMSIGDAPTRRRFFHSWNDFLAKMVDELAPLDPFHTAAEAVLGRKLEPLEDPLMLAWRARGWQGKASIFLREGVRDPQGNLVAPSLHEALEAATARATKEEHSARINQFRAYAYARRLLEIAPRVKLLPGEGTFGREQVLADAQATVSKFDTPEFRRAFDMLQQYQEQLIRQTLGNSGLYTQETINRIIASNQAYLPLHRVFEAMEAGRAKGAGRGYVDIQEAIKKLKGSSRLVVDPLESIVKNTYLFVSLAERNKVGVAVAELAEKAPGLGTWAEHVSPKHYAQTVNLEEVLKRANKQLYESVKEVADDLGLDLDQTVTLFRPAVVAAPKENIAIIWRDGKPELWHLHPDLYEAMKWLDRETMTPLWQLLSYPAQILRAGAVLYNPVFWLRNPLRDQWTAFVFSKYGYVPGVDLVRGIFHILKHDEMYQLYHASGAAQSALVSFDRNYLQADLRKLLGEGKRSFLETLRELSETMELATRIGEFEHGLTKLGQTEEGLLRAAIAARDITVDFGRSGTWGKQINKLAAFFNANVQGIDKLIRVFKEDPVGASFRAILAITLPSIALYLMNRKNPRYWALSDYERDLYWHIPLPDGSFVRIAKPFEVGLLFGSFPERVLQWVDQQDASAMDTLGAIMSPYVSNLIHGILPNPIPTVAAPVVGWIWREVMAGRPVVPLSMQGLPPEEQYGPYTSTVGRLVGKALNISPMWFDEFVRSYMGGMGTATVDLIDDALRLADMPAPPAKDGLPILRTFIYGFRTRPTSSTDPLTQRFYEIVNEIEGRYRTARIRIERGETQAMTPTDIWWGTQASLCNRMADFLSELRKIQRVALTSPNLTDHERQLLWEVLDSMMMNYVRTLFGQPMLVNPPEKIEEATQLLPSALNEYLRRLQILEQTSQTLRRLNRR